MLTSVKFGTKLFVFGTFLIESVKEHDRVTQFLARVTEIID